MGSPVGRNLRRVRAAVSRSWAGADVDGDNGADAERLRPDVTDPALLLTGDGKSSSRTDGFVEAYLLIDEGTRWVRMAEPGAVVVADSPADVPDVVREAEAAARRGCFAVGWLTYEAGAAFGLPVLPTGSDMPLAAFALYAADDVRIADPPAPAAYTVSRPQPGCDWPTYAAAFERVREHIAEGETYQVNGTFDLHARFTGDPGGLLRDLARTQRGRYAASLRLGNWSICSASPELFFSRRGTTLVTRPMKGTAARGRTPLDDRAAAERLRASAKERAENVMIVDMMRNDLGRVARVGSVRVPRLFSVERYPTVWQMTSEVTAESAAPLDAIIEALFPSASVTGAPKIRTMEIIRAFERRPRGIYTGAIGYLAPGGDAQFSVAIRTAVVDHRHGSLTFGVGSGIVWDSDARAEYQECLLKGAVLGLKDEPFELLETLAWTPGDGYALLNEHMDRLRQSAEYFEYRLDADEIEKALAAAVAGRGHPQRVRLLVNESGHPRTESYRLDEPRSIVRACVARDPIDTSDVFLYHKTTRRRSYDARTCPQCDDVILRNERDELTESTRSNLVVDLDGERLTPPVASGLLAGTFRARLLRDGSVHEGTLHPRDLVRARGIWLVNSVRGWQPVHLQQH